MADKLGISGRIAERFQATEITPLLEVPTVLGPVQQPFIPDNICATLKIAWVLITIPLMFGLAIVYYLHYRDSSAILLKLRIFFAQIRAQAKMRIEKE